MTAVQIKCGTEAPPRKLLRHRRRLLGALAAAATLAAAIVLAHHYGLILTHNKFKGALAALDRGDFKLVRHYARELKASQPASPRAKFLRGAMLLEKGYCYPALDELRQAEQDAELEIAALTLMGQAWYRLGRHVEAQAALQRVLRQEPDSVEAHRWLAASYYDLGVIGRAAHHLQRTAELDSADPRPHRLLALIHKDFEQFEDAIPLYEESLRRDGDQPSAAEIRQELATCQVEARRYDDALATLAKCSDRPAFNVLRAKCHRAQGDLKRAKAALARSLEQDGDHLEGLLLQGAMSLEDGDARAAIEAFQRAVKAHPKDYEAHFMLAKAYAQSGEQELSDQEEASAEEIRVVRHEFSQLHKWAGGHPDDVQARLRMANLAQQLDRPDLAEVWLRAANALQAAAQAP